MSKQHLQFLKNEVIDEVTAGRIREYEAKANVTVTLPIPLEQIVEQVLGLDFDWDIIEEHPGEQILGGLDAVNKKILLNEKHVDLFDSKPGLLRSTIGHEAGHYDIDIDRSKLLHPKLPGMDFKAAMRVRQITADRLRLCSVVTRLHDLRPDFLLSWSDEGEQGVKILFVHGWHSVPGGVKPTYLKDAGHDVINPKLDDDDVNLAVRTAQAEYNHHKPDVIVGSSRGGAVAMNIDSRDTPLILLCPAWKNWGTCKILKPNSVILHSRQDDVIPFADSEELVTNSGVSPDTLIEVGEDHRLADPEPLKAMLKGCDG
jgi:hypothetical protein